MGARAMSLCDVQADFPSAADDAKITGRIGTEPVSGPDDDSNHRGGIDTLQGLLRDERSLRRAAEKTSAALAARVEQLSRRLEQQTELTYQAEHRLGLIVNQLGWGVVLEDAEGRIVLANQRYCELFRLKMDPEKLVGAFLPAIDQNAGALFIEPEGYVGRLTEIRRAPSLVLGDMLELTDGQIWLRDSVPLESDDGHAGLLHLLRDVTEESALRAELKKVRADADAVGHGSTDFLAATMLAEGRLRLSQGPLSPQELLSSVAEQWGENARSKGLEIEVLVDENLPRTVLGDEACLRQLLMGLLSNAIQFTQAGSIQLRAFRPSEGSLDDVCYSILDTGIGIPESERERVFERYYRINAEAPGKGVGLGICRDLVHLMGGWMAMESTTGKGTTISFSVTQPALTADQPSEFDKHVPRSTIKSGKSSQQGTRVLLVEDDTANRILMTRVLERAGYQVRPVDNAEAGLAALEEKQVDALVTDISMPGMDGIEMVAALRAVEERSGASRLPTVVVTAHATTEYQGRCRKAGVDVFLTKPLVGPALCRALARLAPQVARVLLADDARDSRVLLEVCLRQYESPLVITAANSGKTALAACREQVFSLVFLDVFMPDGGGVATLHELRRLPGYENVPVVAVTGVSELGEVEALQRQGFTHVLQKPIDRNRILRVVRQCLHRGTVTQRPPIGRTALESAPTQMQLEAVRHVLESPASSDSVPSVSTDIRELAPSFLNGRKAEVRMIRDLLLASKFGEIQTIGHNLKGTGASFGFSAITLMGDRLESAAKREDKDEVLVVCQQLERFLDSVLI